MYLTDFREQRLKDVITKLEPKLFKRVTGLTTADFERLVSLGIFNSAPDERRGVEVPPVRGCKSAVHGREPAQGAGCGAVRYRVTEEDFKATFEGLAAE